MILHTLRKLFQVICEPSYEEIFQFFSYILIIDLYFIAISDLQVINMRLYYLWRYNMILM